MVILDNAGHYNASTLLLYRAIKQTLTRTIYYSLYPKACYNTTDDDNEHKLLFPLHRIVIQAQRIKN